MFGKKLKIASGATMFKRFEHLGKFSFDVGNSLLIPPFGRRAVFGRIVERRGIVATEDFAVFNHYQFWHKNSRLAVFVGIETMVLKQVNDFLVFWGVVGANLANIVISNFNIMLAGYLIEILDVFLAPGTFRKSKINRSRARFELFDSVRERF